MRLSLCLDAVVLALASATPSHADGLSFTLTGVTFNEGGSLTGTININTITGLVTSADLLYGLPSGGPSYMVDDVNYQESLGSPGDGQVEVAIGSLDPAL